VIKYINIFKKKNNLKCSKTSSKETILICDRGRPAQMFFSSLFAYNINKNKKHNVFVLSDKKVSTEYNKYFYNAFNINNFYLLNFKNINLILLKSFFESIYQLFKITFNNFDNFAENFKFKNIYCGDLIWDTYIRHDHSFLNPKINLKFYKIIFNIIYKINFLDDFIKKRNVKIILSSANNYSSLSGISLRIGLKYKIKTYYQKFHKVIKIKRFSDIRKSPFILSKNELLDKYKFKDNFIFTKYFENRMNAKNLPKRPTKNTIDVISAFQNKINDEKYFFKKINRNRNNFKNICVFAPHAFSDCNHAFGKLIYRDYFQNFVETLKIIKNNKENLWIVKPHPSSYFFNEVGIVEKYLKKFTQNNLVICPNNISTKLILRIADKIVTSRGTIGLESACIGKKAIITGSSPYSHLGLSLNPKNKEIYKRMLKSTKKEKKLSNNKQKLAKKYLYWFAMDKVYDELNFIQVDRNKKNSFIKNLIKLQKTPQFKFKILSYMKYLNKLV
jgi:hypothetical protein